MSSSTDLETIKAEIETIGNRIRDLKGSGGSKEEIGAAVEALNAAKKQYADNNNGIGVDGKPYQENLTKAQKKALAKAQKDAAPPGGNSDVRFFEQSNSRPSIGKKTASLTIISMSSSALT